MFRRWCAAVALLGLTLASLPAEPAPLAQYDQVEIAPTKTSIYIGRVAMTLPPFVRQNGTYTSTYSAHVFPYFFLNEQGRLSIDVSDSQLRALERGERIEFHGLAHNTHGEERRVEGTATPADADSGKIKVRVFVSKRIQLIFNTTYRFRRASES
ncbi:hypothetical protein [Opitutus terrae]|uniref:DUF5666 domain-containing protein n=1 Tax=Opitutus terrae (strain DSM 11246 / JCM 15787 / PB90-1) TaxID=452637 RepID=B1ZZY4_OPITP|nr:hypothetical protein [Opitutus terrae]ACB77320.1 hypothetical protein Oter_4046 [Opitutus terrae PB90-1]